LNDRWENWHLNVPSAIIDTWTSSIEQPDLESWQYYCPHKKCYALKYKVLCSLGNPRICWLAGLFKEAANDATISHASGIKAIMQPNEAFLADKQYRGDPTTFICPASRHRYSLNDHDNQRNALIYSARQFVEQLIKQLRHFTVLTNR
jgi:hypothetical protein